MKDFLLRNKLALIVGTLLTSQFLMLVTQLLTWQATNAVAKEVTGVWRLIARESCGGPDYLSRACRVVIVQP